MTRSANGRADDGAVLVLVLAFLAGIGVVTLALLSQTGAGVRSTTVIADFGKKLYSADSALDVALEALQNDPTLCPDKPVTAGQTTDITSSLAVDSGIDAVKVTCRTTAGSSGGYKGYSIVTTDDTVLADGKTVVGLSTQSSGSKKVNGSVFVAGSTDLKKPVELTRGNYVQAGTPCPAAADVTVVAPFIEVCSPRATPTLDAIAPAVPGATNPAPDITTVPGCSIFSPGRYTTQPVLNPLRNYFKSGVYYFDFAGNWDIRQTSVVGGTAGSEFTYLDAPCLLESMSNGDGVEWVFRGTSTLTVSNSARVELFSRRPTSPTVDGTRGVSIFVQGTRTTSSLDQLNGNPKAIFHGLVYSPQASVGTNATGTVSLYMLNGVVASRLLLQSVGEGLLVSTSEGESVRSVVLEATARKGSDGRSVVARAVCTVEPDGTLKVLSRWTK